MSNPQDLIIKLKYNLPLFAEMFLKIVTAQGKLEPLIFNRTQLTLHTLIEQQLSEIGMVRAVIPKGRKQGVSTYVSARYFHKVIFHANKRASMITHHSSATSDLFGMVETFYKNLPEQFRVKLLSDNQKGWEFENNSRYMVSTAGSGEIGRGGTPQLLHVSEIPSFEHPEQIEAGILNSVADEAGTEIIMESTAKGPGDLFHRYAMLGVEKTGYERTFFMGWNIHEKNVADSNNIPPQFKNELDDTEKDLQQLFNLTIPQLYWRRMKVLKSGEGQFKSEYPITIAEAFSASGEKFFKSSLIQSARKSVIQDNFSPLVIGCDPGREGDRTVIAYRRGRQFIKIERHKKMEQMQLAGILARIINEEKPMKVFVDVAHGYGTLDRLRELGFKDIAIGVNFGEKPLYQTKYKNNLLFRNKRAEMYFALKDWFEDGECRIPDDDDIELDLLSMPPYKEDSSNRVLMEEKKIIKKKFGKSPDIADAMILTFAYPVRNPTVAFENDSRYHNPYTSSKQFKMSPIMKSFYDRTEGQDIKPAPSHYPKDFF